MPDRKVKRSTRHDSVVPYPESVAVLDCNHPHPRPVTATKRDRQNVILELIATKAVGSQEELRQLLLTRGWEVTQSTLSRDMRDLRIARIPSASGHRYAVAEGSPEDGGRAALGGILPQLFKRLEGVGHLIVLKTVVGSAQTVAAAIDGDAHPDILGTIAGDDTILMICRSETARERVALRLTKLAQR